MSPEHLNTWRGLILTIMPDVNEVWLLLTWDTPTLP